MIECIKKCSCCKVFLNVDYFNNSKKTRDGKYPRCKPCDREARAIYKANNEKRFKLIAREKFLRHSYGIDLKDYQSMLEAQNFSCKICFTKNPNGLNSSSNYNKNFAVDHCHTTGKIRGLLCVPCNRCLGMLGENIIVLQNMITYLIENN